MMDIEQTSKPTCSTCGYVIVEPWESGPVNDECYQCNRRMYLPQMANAVTPKGRRKHE